MRQKVFAWPLSIVCALGIVLNLSSCSGSAAGPVRTVRVGTYASLDHLPFLIMSRRGLDRKNGVSIQPTFYSGGAAVLAALAANEIDAGSAGTIPLLDAAQKGLLRESLVNVASNIYTNPAHPTGAVIASSSVTSWQELEGAYIAINNPVSLGGWAIVDRLRTEGVKGYSLVSYSLENQGLAVAGGNVKAAVMFEPYITQSLLRGDGKLLGWVVGGPPLERIEFSCFVFRKAFITQSPGAAHGLLKAYVQATRWLVGHEQDARAILAQGLSVGTDVAQKMILPEWRTDCRNDPALLSQMQKTLLDAGFIKEVVPAQSLYDETLLDKVLGELR
jgi:NitT/TauT family transport system substrate-binding protein